MMPGLIDQVKRAAQAQGSPLEFQALVEFLGTNPQPADPLDMARERAMGLSSALPSTPNAELATAQQDKTRAISREGQEQLDRERLGPPVSPEEQRAREILRQREITGRSGRSYGERQFQGDLVRFFSDLVPGIGDALAVKDLVEDPNVWTGVGAAVGMVPVVGDLTKGAVRATKDIAERFAQNIHIFGGSDSEMSFVRDLLISAMKKVHGVIGDEALYEFTPSNMNVRIVNPEDFPDVEAGGKTLLGEKDLSAHLYTWPDGRSQLSLNKNLLGANEFTSTENDLIHEMMHKAVDDGKIPKSLRDKLGAMPNNDEDLVIKLTQQAEEMKKR
jgi:hypothetical protein